MEAETPGTNIALLIDADNASPNDLETVLTVLAELGSVNIRRVYGNWQKPTLNGWAGMVHLQALEPQQQFDVTKGKSATDMKIIIDAMDLLHSGRVGGFGLMSSDSDFMPLAMRIRQNGIPVYGFGESKTPESFKRACTRFIDVSALRQSVQVEDGPKAQIDDALVAVLSDAIKASKRDERGFASLSEVGHRTAARSSFDARNYGFSRLSDLIKSLPNFVTEMRGSVMFVKRGH